MAGLDLDEDVVFVTGIGCTGRASMYIEADGFHTTHGRAIPFAMGVKMANPDLNVIVFSGDGDLFAIGGNHFIHAARRNLDITVICDNNSVYGLTGGQASPTSFEESRTPTTINKNDPPFNLVDLALGAGASYVARYTAIDFNVIPRAVKEAIETPGFSFIDLVSGCPALYGKRNGFPTGPDVIKQFKKARVQVEPKPDGSHLLPENTKIIFKPGEGYVRIPIGVFRRRTK